MRYLIYCDGACSNNGKASARGGWASVILKEIKNGKELRDWDENNVEILKGSEIPSTNNKMELIACISALESITIKPFDEIVVRTDSAYIHNCVSAGWYKSWERNGWINSKKEKVKNRELWERLIPYFKNPSVCFEKVKGHSGDIWNEFVDRLAVESAEKGESNEV